MSRFFEIGQAARQTIPGYVTELANESSGTLVKMLGRLGFAELGEAIIGARFRVIGTRRHPVRVELFHPASAPAWWSPRCRELLHLASCRQLKVVSEKWNTMSELATISLGVPPSDWRPEDETRIRELDLVEPISF